jgi:hypothetical protein
MLEDQVVWDQFLARARNVSLLYMIHTSFGTRQASCTTGTGACFPPPPPDKTGAGREVDRSPPYSAEVKNWGDALTPPSVFMVHGN